MQKGKYGIHHMDAICLVNGAHEGIYTEERMNPAKTSIEIYKHL